MRILLANRDRAPEWAPEIRQTVRRMEAQRRAIFLPPEIAALRLREARSEREYLEILTDLVRRRQHIDTLGYEIPRRKGILGLATWAVRSLLWVLLRYQHERLAFRQNRVNSNLVALLEAQGAEIAALRRELERLRERPPA
ncbi:MAG: hypothetical protein NZ740_07345 [Kiritimatiellae bacterium]|nr:hypothetical protein [Kiritimatiellia bacterium]MDW8458913.1 hypothetical protein [Verrucomicrobiota bacterium]